MHSRLGPEKIFMINDHEGVFLYHEYLVNFKKIA